MWLKDFKKDTMAISKVAIAIIIVVLLLASTFAAYVLVFNEDNSSVGTGDSITVNYWGTVNIQGVDKVFDTSIWDVALDNETYPKAAWFSMKTQASYSEFTFTVGRGQTITGFDMGIKGMKEGDSRTIVVTPEQGYGVLDETKIVTIDLNQTVSVFMTTTKTAFNSTFGSVPSAGLTVTHPTYGWPVTVLSVNEETKVVEYQNVPTQGSQYKVFANSNEKIVSGWNITVNSVDTTVSEDGEIKFTHMVDEEDSWNIKGYVGTTMFILIDVDTAAGTARTNYNSPLAGLTLTFHVTLESIN
ncbi:MAG: FKBP-type peptidyl-prolyl cis-trans isomerase [Euryarchaeota archaeon]|nr:FKBP-type peptidyl-prolyl cis-trans isomerase [Euryarchaeota archaeon]